MNFLSNSIYSLKRRYGTSVTYHSFVSATKDLDAGEIAQVVLSLSIRQAVVLPEKMARRFIYDLAYVAANKNFTYGGFFDAKESVVAVDSVDLGVIIPKVDDIIFLNSGRYEIKKVADYPESKLYILIALRHENEIGSSAGIVITPDLSPDLAYGESVGDTINVGHLIFANGQDLYLATNDDEDRPALGIVTHIVDGKIYHTRNNIVRGLTVAGTPHADYKDIYLATNGGLTFTAPSATLTQKVGFMLKENIDGSFDCIINITDNIAHS